MIRWFRLTLRVSPLVTEDTNPASALTLPVFPRASALETTTVAFSEMRLPCILEMMRPVPLDVLPYSEFGRMRIGSFVPPGTEIVKQSYFEWMGGLWLHEGIGFTWFGRLMAQPDQTAGLEVFFEELDEASIERILQFLRLPLNPGMKTEKLHDLFGGPSTTKVFTSDRKTYSFRIGQGDQYQVSCTVQDDGGLIHLSVIRSDIRRQLALAAEKVR
jgi:hypothetical protein